MRINQDEVMKASKESTRICLTLPDQFKTPVDPVSEESSRYEIKDQVERTVSEMR